MFIANTGFWLALLDKKETYHRQAEKAINLKGKSNVHN